MVAPVRCATPGTEVDCATHFCASHSATIQSTSTPPPWPPIASTAMASGFVVSSATREESTFIGSRIDRHALRAPRLQPTDHASADPREEALERTWIVHDLGAVERRAQHRGFRHFAAIAAADARIIDGRDRIVFQR